MASSGHARATEGRPAAALAASLLLGVGACAEPAIPAHEVRYAAAMTIEDIVEQQECSTDPALGLSWQVAREVQCLAPGEFIEFDPKAGMVFGPAVLPMAAPGAVVELEGAAVAAPNTAMVLTSAFRAVGQQYILYRWGEMNTCGISVVAKPGLSNHESGRAIDLSNFAAWTEHLPGFGWTQNVPNDAVHFEHLASSDLRGLDVLAFQRLWNRAHPNDPIAEDGDYGAQTGARLAMAPADGFALPNGCVGASSYAVDVVARNAPSHMAPRSRGQVELVLSNSGNSSWPVGTRLMTSAPARFCDEPTWADEQTAAILADAVPPGGEVMLSFLIEAPELAAPGVVTEVFALQHPQSGSFGLVTLTTWVSNEAALPPGEAPQSPPPQLAPDTAEHGTGCAASASANGPMGMLWLSLAALAVWRRRRC